ncbi:MAG: hypothetical protein EON58_01555 [Alphaproteobacteria bacterium]|nr:MAG: hypothetical protein EON58_01555 [Alphaproteobacteria bacterium]
MNSMLEIRNVINSIINSDSDAVDISTPALIRAVRERHPDLVAAAHIELQNLGLSKIVNQVAARQKGPARPGQLEMFGGYTGIRQTIVVKSTDADGKVSLTRKPTEQATLEELEHWLKDRTEARKENTDKFSGMWRLLADAQKAGCAPNAIIGQAITDKIQRTAF